MTDHMTREIERAINEAEHPRGMSTHDGMARISAATLRRLHELAEKYKWEVRDTCVRAEKAEAQRDELLEALRYHQDQTRPIQRSIDAIAKATGGAA